MAVTGRCLCESVRFRVTVDLRPVINCHCHRCRRHTGHFLAATQCKADDVEFDSMAWLRWFPPDERVGYGFCEQCGSTLFWRCDDRPTLLSIAAGSLDSPTGLRTAAAIWTIEASDYYELDPDLPCHVFGTGGQVDPPSL